MSDVTAKLAELGLELPKPAAPVAAYVPVVELGGHRVAAARTTVLPAADPGTRTTEIRLDLPESVAATPGQFAHVHFALAMAASAPRLSVPAAAILRRSELTAVYVKTTGGRFQQRQVRLGEELPEGRVEVLAGLRAGENVALDPVKAGLEAVAPAAGRYVP